MALTSGLVNACSAVSGGISTIWITNSSDIDIATGVTVVADVVTVIPLIVGGAWTKFEFKEETAFRKDTSERSDSGAQPVTHQLQFMKVGLDAATITSIQELSDASNCGLVAIVKDLNGIKWFVGWSELLDVDRPLYLKTGTVDSGTASTDAPSVTVLLEAVDSQYTKTTSIADPS